MQPFFSETSYDTPGTLPRFLMDRVFLGTRYFFAGGYINEIIKARSLAVKDRYDDESWAESSYRVFKLIEGCGGRFHLRGLDNIKKSRKPVVFVSNHMSTLETFVFPCIIVPFTKVTFVVKESLVRHPLFGPVMRSRDPIVVSRNNPRDDLQTVMNKGKELLAGGTSIVIFPQSTRTTKFIPEEFNSLGIKLAKKAGVQVVPVAIKTDFWGNGKLIKDLGPINRKKHIHMFFGRPFYIEGSGKEEHRKTVEFILANLKKWESS